MLEGDDDMPAHAKAVIAGVTLNDPDLGRKIDLGTWREYTFASLWNRGEHVGLWPT